MMENNGGCNPLGRQWLGLCGGLLWALCEWYIGGNLVRNRKGVEKEVQTYFYITINKQRWFVWDGWNFGPPRVNAGVLVTIYKQFL